MPSNDISKQLDKLKRNKRLLWLAILAFVIVVMWIGIGLVSTQNKVTISQDLQTLATPLVPRIEATVFEQIAVARSFSEQELAQFPIYAYITDERNNTPRLIDITQATASSPLSLTSQPGISATPTPTMNEEASRAAQTITPTLSVSPTVSPSALTVTPESPSP